MVGATQPPGDDATRAAVLLVGSKGTSCTGVAIARDLVLTAGALRAAGRRLQARRIRRRAHADAQGHRRDRARIRSSTPTAALRHRVTADVALIKFPAAGDGNARAARAGGRQHRGRRPLRDRGLRPRGARRRQERRHAAHRHARRHRPAGLAATASRRSRHQGRARRASAPAPAIPARRCSATSAAR